MGKGRAESTSTGEKRSRGRVIIKDTLVPLVENRSYLRFKHYHRLGAHNHPQSGDRTHENPHRQQQSLITRDKAGTQGRLIDTHKTNVAACLAPTTVPVQLGGR